MDLSLGVSPSSPPTGRERIATWWHYCDACDSENVHAEAPSAEVEPMAILEFSLIMDFLMYFKLIGLDKISSCSRLTRVLLLLLFVFKDFISEKMKLELYQFSLFSLI